MESIKSCKKSVFCIVLANDLTLSLNYVQSCSGHLLLGAYLGPQTLETKVGEELYTGSHLASMEAVVTSKAHLAAIDCVTWALGRIHLGLINVISSAYSTSTTIFAFLLCKMQRLY